MPWTVWREIGSVWESPGEVGFAFCVALPLSIVLLPLPLPVWCVGWIIVELRSGGRHGRA